MKTQKMLAAFALVFLAGSASNALAEVLYSQSMDPNGNVLASQNDAGGFGNFATVYDNFSLAGNATVNNVTFVGSFFNPGSHGNITGFTVNFWADSAGQPGSLLSSTVVAGNGLEVFLGNYSGFPTYEYSVNVLAFGALAGTEYWMSVVPDLVFPPQWGWKPGAGGDGSGYQDFFGNRTQIQTDFAFTLNGTGSNVPDSGATVALLGVAFIGLASLRRRFAR